MFELYKVKRGDNLEKIARIFETSVAELYRLNSWGPNVELTEGMMIIVPVKAGPLFEYYQVKQGDNLAKIGNMYNVDADTLAAINGLDLNEYIYPNQQLLVPKENIEIYVTVDNDTINTVSRKLKNSPADILRQNETIYLLPNQLIIYKK